MMTEKLRGQNHSFTYTIYRFLRRYSLYLCLKISIEPLALMGAGIAFQSLTLLNVILLCETSRRLCGTWNVLAGFCLFVKREFRLGHMELFIFHNNFPELNLPLQSTGRIFDSLKSGVTSSCFFLKLIMRTDFLC